MPAQIVDLRRREVDVFEEFERLLEAGGDQIVPSLREMTHEKLKRGLPIEAGLQIARGHREFVEIGEKSRMFIHAIGFRDDI